MGNTNYDIRVARFGESFEPNRGLDKGLLIDHGQSRMAHS